VFNFTGDAVTPSYAVVVARRLTGVVVPAAADVAVVVASVAGCRDDVTPPLRKQRFSARNQTYRTDDLLYSRAGKKLGFLRQKFF